MQAYKPGHLVIIKGLFFSGLVIGLLAGCDAAPSGSGEAPNGRADVTADEGGRGAADAVRATVSQGPDAISASGGALHATIPLRSSGWVELRSPTKDEAEGLRVGLPHTERGGQAAVAADGTVTYQDGLAATDVVVTPFDGGLRIQTVLKDRSAPTEFLYPVALPAGGQLVVAEGGVLIQGNGGEVLGGAAPPWARDNRAQTVPTRFEVRGNTIVQIVEHQGGGVAYPVVADPWLGRKLIDRAYWSRVSQGWIIHVVPTTWAKVWSGYAPSVAGWNELYDRYKNSGLNTNLGSMKNQYICHQMLNLGGRFGGPTWDLEEWRPDIGLPAFMAARCNPGGGSS